MLLPRETLEGRTFVPVRVFDQAVRPGPFPVYLYYHPSELGVRTTLTMDEVMPHGYSVIRLLMFKGE
jgi:hypothetical protein